MSTLTYSHDSIGVTHAPARSGGSARHRPLWRRAFDAIVASQQRRAERDIANYLANHGGLFTDDMEREMMRRLSGNARRSI